MLRKWSIAALTLGAFFVLSAGLPAEGPLKYPPAPRGDQVDEYHGTKVADPYRWLEEDVRKSKEVSAWVAAENKVTDAYLATIPERKGIRDRLTKLWDYARSSAPSKAGDRYFFLRNNGLQNQSVLFVSEGLDGKPRVLLDPNKLSKDGTVALSGMA